MKKLLFLCAIGLLSYVGCSKQPDESGSPASGRAASGSDSQEKTRSIKPGLSKVESHLETEEYDKVFEGLQVLRSVPKTKEQRKEYKETVYKVESTLRKQAESDPEARKAYDYFGKVMTGR